MKIAYDPEKFGELKPGDEVQLMATGVVSDDGKAIEVLSVEDEELSDHDEEDDDKDKTESPKEETEADADEELAEGADLESIIASGVGL